MDEVFHTSANGSRGIRRPATSSPLVNGEHAPVNGHWHPAGIPFFWIPKAGFDRLEQALERGAAATAKLVYVALCIIANREGSSSFEKPLNYISVLASLDRRTVERRLADLKRIGLVSIESRQIPGTSGPAPSRYTLTSQSHDLTSQSHDIPAAVKPLAVILPIEQENEEKAHTHRETFSLKDLSDLDPKIVPPGFDPAEEFAKAEQWAAEHTVPFTKGFFLQSWLPRCKPRPVTKGKPARDPRKKVDDFVAGTIHPRDV
jgi:hypothetical protein